MKITAIYTMLFSLLLGAASAQAAGAFSLSYGGRLSNASDEAEKGPVDLEMGFYKSAKGTDVITVVPKTSVTLDDGVFQVDLDLTATERASIFGDGSSTVWVEIVDKTHKKTYPRQMLTAVPYAIAAQTVPVDGTTVSFDSNGKLKANITSPTGQDMVTAINSSSGTLVAARIPSAAGDVTGSISALTVGKIQGRAVSATAPTTGQVLTWNNTGAGSWEPNNPAGTGTVTQVTAGAGLTGGPITSSGTIELSLNSSGGLSKVLGGGSNELGIANGGVTDVMLAGSISDGKISSASTWNSAATAVGNATDANTATKIVQRDASGNFSAGTITATLNGSAADFSGSLSGDVSGTQNATSVDKIRGQSVLATAPSSGQYLQYNGSAWEPATPTPAILTGGQSAGGSNLAFGASDSSGVEIKTNNASRMTITAGGNVGIGITTPSDLLQVQQPLGGGDARIHVENTATGAGSNAGFIAAVASISANPFTSFYTTGATHWTLGVDNADSGKFKIQTGMALSGAAGLTVTSSGNVGVGTATPSATLDIKGAGSSNSTSGLVIRNSSGLAKFEVRDDGSTKLNGMPYTWPSSQASGMLTNDGSGVLNWTPPPMSVTGGCDIGGGGSTGWGTATGGCSPAICTSSIASGPPPTCVLAVWHGSLVPIGGAWNSSCSAPYSTGTIFFKYVWSGVCVQ